MTKHISDKDKFTLKKLNKTLRHQTGQAIADYNMVQDGDRIMVCLSGGKDSYTLLEMLMQLKAVAPVEQDTYSIVKEKLQPGKTTCSLCSRLRRGILYKTAKELGATKIALGHHRDDMLATMMLNLFFAGKMKSMPAKLVSDNGEHVVIRPLAYCKEKEIEQFSTLKGFPIIPCNLCGSQPNLQRKMTKDMLNEWEVNYPGRLETMFTAIQNVVPSHLADTSLFDFKSITKESGVIDGGDIAFDKETFPAPESSTPDSENDYYKAQPAVQFTEIN